MQQKFTSREVRATVAGFSGYNLMAMLYAYADRLEADEKAVPAAWLCTDESADDADDRRFATLDKEDASRFPSTSLYTHPAPADAERLAEALRAIDSAMQGVLSYFEIRRSIGTVEFPESAHGVAVRALAVHSAQAQPPAASVRALQEQIAWHHAEAARLMQQIIGDPRDSVTVNAQEKPNG